jgi:hypothetical protein
VVVLLMITRLRQPRLRGFDQEASRPAVAQYEVLLMCSIIHHWRLITEGGPDIKPKLKCCSIGWVHDKAANTYKDGHLGANQLAWEVCNSS